LGRLLRAMPEAPMALVTSGLSMAVTRMLVFCLSAFLAAIGGALIGVSQGVVSSDAYPPLLSLTYVVLIVIVVGSEPFNAVLAALAIVVIPAYITGTQTTNWLQLLFGVTAVLTAVRPPRAVALPASLRRWLDSRFGTPAHDRAAPPPPGSTVPRNPSSARSGLTVRGLSVRFGGLIAVQDMDLEVPAGRVTGLIGPNGAGKTTTFNACSGFVRAASGRMEIGGRDISRDSPAARARMGLGRSFQQPQLFESLTVVENIALGREAAVAGANPVRQVFGRGRERVTIAQSTAEALMVCELDEIAQRRASALSTGQRRRVEVARCLAGDPSILLLDEPSAGLDHAETAKLAALLRRVISERGIGILLVEHDMSLVRDVCEYVYVLDFGRPIFEGPTAEALASPIVQAAYLGTVESAHDSGLDELTVADEATA